MENMAPLSRNQPPLPDLTALDRHTDAWDKSWEKERATRFSVRQLLGNITQGAFYGVAALATDIIIDRASGKKFGSGKKDINFNPKRGSKVLLSFIAAGGVFSYIADGQIANIELMESDRLARRTAQAKAHKHTIEGKEVAEISDQRHSPKWWQVLWPTQKRDASPDDKEYDLPWMKEFHRNRAKCSWYELISRSAFFGMIVKACTMMLNKTRGKDVAYHSRNTPLAMGALTTAGIGFAILAQKSWTKQELLKDNRRARRLTLEKTGIPSENAGAEKDTGANAMADPINTSGTSPSSETRDGNTPSMDNQMQEAAKAYDEKWTKKHTVLLTLQKVCESLSTGLFLGVLTAMITDFMKGLASASNNDKATSPANNNRQNWHGIPKSYLTIAGFMSIGGIFTFISSRLNTKVNMMQSDRLSNRVTAGITDEGYMPPQQTGPNNHSRTDASKDLKAPETDKQKNWAENREKELVSSSQGHSL